MARGGDTDPLSGGPRLEGIDINELLKLLPVEQLAALDIHALLKTQLDASSQQQIAVARGKRERNRFRLLLAVLALIVLEFAVGAAILTWDSDESWSDVKDLLAYGLAPLAAMAALAGSFYFPSYSPDG